MEFEKVFPELCHFGRYQKLIYFFVLLPCQISFYIHLYSHIFFTYQPDHWCSNQSLPMVEAVSPLSLSSNISTTTKSSSTTSSNQIQNLSTSALTPQSFLARETFRRFFYIPHRGFIDKKYFNNIHTLHDYISGYDRCNIFNATFTEIDNFHKQILPLFENFRDNYTLKHYFDGNHIFSPPIVQCNSWNFNRTALLTDETLVTKWSLVCNREWMQLLPLSALLTGYCFVQLFYDSLVQRIGHRTVFFLSLLLQCSSVAGSAFVQDFRIFCLFRFITGCTLHSTVQVPIDLMLELSGVRCMSNVVFFNESIRLIGGTILGTIASYIFDYRQLSLVLSIPFAVLLLFYCSFPESLRYLLINGQIDRLEKIIITIAHTNLRFHDPELDASIQRRIYVELELYRELVLALMLPEASIPLRENIEQSDRKISNSSTLVENFVKSLQESSTSPTTEMVDVSSHSEQKDQNNETIEEIIETSENNTEFITNNSPNKENITNLTSSPPSDSCGALNSSILSSNSDFNNQIQKQNSSNKQNFYHNNSVSLLKILKFSNLRIKFFILSILSSIHFFIYFSLTFFIADFAAQPEVKTILKTNTYIYLFILNIILNFIGVWLSYGCLHCNFGRKLTFFISNILSTIFILLTGLCFSNKFHITFLQNSTIFYYCVTKIFQTVCFNVLTVWIYELLPPSASCSGAIRACTFITTLVLNFLPLSLHFWTSECRFCFESPSLIIPCHYLIGTVGLFLSCLLCLFLPETGSCSRLPNNLHEAEHFNQWNTSSTSSSSSSASSMSTASTVSASLNVPGPSTNSSSSDSSNNNNNCFSVRALFNFQPPNVRPGILKKSTIQSRESAILRRKRQLDNILEQKFAAITSDCANKTAYNSVCNQFLNTSEYMNGKMPLSYVNTQTNHRPTSVLQTSIKHPKDCHLNINTNGYHQSFSQDHNTTTSSDHHSTGNGFRNAGFWFGALADGVATGLPLLNYFNPNPVLAQGVEVLPLNGKTSSQYRRSIENNDNDLFSSTSQLDDTNLSHWFGQTLDLEPTTNSNVHLVDVELNSPFQIPQIDDDSGLFDNNCHNLTQALAFEMEIPNPIILDI